MACEFTEAELEAYLDEALTPAEMSDIEAALRENEEIAVRLRAIHGRRDAGVHSLGEIWRRHRVSCPDREQLGSYLLQVLETSHQEFVRFHLEEIGCRYCNANLEDLQARQQEIESATQTRRRRYFQSTAGYFAKEE
ncbi:MAG: hypothetical protein GY768_25565 [Planctomycetaceae bacterium]|nr:hypothetical protein [Planctomycetaceae bacterium]